MLPIPHLHKYLNVSGHTSRNSHLSVAGLKANPLENCIWFCSKTFSKAFVIAVILQGDRKKKQFFPLYHILRLNFLKTLCTLLILKTDLYFYRMKHILLFVIIFLFCHHVHSQSWGDSTMKNGPVFYSVEVAPKFPGGMSGYYRFLAENLKMPENKFLRFSNKSGIVKVIIDKTGKVAFAEIEKGINESYNLAVLEMIKAMPDWSPALQNNRPVPVSISLPILFVD